VWGHRMADFDDLQKTPRQVDWEYLAWIKSLPCLVTGKVGADPHHLSSVGSGGSDYSAVPLKRKFHNEIEQIGVKEFEVKYKLSVWYSAWSFLLKWYLSEQKNHKQAVEEL